MIERLKPYSEVQPSGAPWLGCIPKHWKVLPNRTNFLEVKTRGNSDEEMLSVTIAQGVVRQALLLAGGAKKDSSNEDKSKYKLVRPGEIAYNKMRAWQGAIGVSQYLGIVSPAYVVLRLRGGNEPKYFHYLLRTKAFAAEAERWSYGITSDQWSLRPEHFKQIYCCVPPLGEQRAIIRFLDYADRRIRNYVNSKKRLIALLSEQRQAIIHHAVTCGLDAAAPLKPSGVAWQGNVPTHWKVWQVSHLARVGNGSTPSRSNTAYWTAGTYPWLNSGSVNQLVIRNATQFVTTTALRECHLPIVPPGSVLVGITGQGKTRGTCALLAIEATINQHLAYITPRTEIVTAHYLATALIGAYQYLRSISDGTGSTKGALTCGDLRHFKVALPPAPEQAQLLAWIQEETKTLDSAITTARREIELLEEYRSRIIADVVTGQLDVREAAAKLPGESDEPEVIVDEFDESDGEDTTERELTEVTT